MNSMDAGSMFVDPLTEKDFKSDQHTEVFDDDAGLSRSERLLVQASGLDLIASLETSAPRQFEKLATEFHRFAQCGNEFLPLDCEQCTTGHYVAIRCRSRLCEDCNEAWAKGIREQLLPAVKNLNANKRRGFVVSHVVLTVGKWWGEERMPNMKEIKQFTGWCSDFTRLHYGKYIGAWSKSNKVVERRKRFLGGASVRVLEFGIDNNNLHAHLIVYGPIKPKNVLDASWSRITGNRGRFIWIQKVRNTKNAVGYIMKELVKSPVSQSYKKMAEYVVAIKGVRRLATGGVLYNRIKTKKIDPDKPICCCTVCGHRLRPGEAVPFHKLGSRVDLWPELYELKKVDSDKKAARDRLALELPSGVMPIISNELQLFCN